MAGLEGAIKSLLTADTAIAAIVADRVRPLYGSQQDKRPFITIQINNAQGTITHSGAAGSRNAVVEIGIITDKYSDSETLRDNINRVLHGYTGTVAGVKICPAHYDDETDVEQTVAPGASKPVYLKTINYRCRYLVIAA